MTQERRDISEFRIVGINYKKTDASIRGRFAINTDQYARLLQLAPRRGLRELFILSTCNRTELYGFASSPAQLMDLLCTETEGDRATFESLAYVKSGREALEHLFQVGAGLDSQILGDYEIVGQIRQSAKMAKEYGLMGAFLERLLNSVMQSSKAIKNKTALSGGTVSVSFAAVQYIREHVSDIKSKNILLLGTGKIGRNTCKNLVHYLHTHKITLVNRTFEKAAQLAEELCLQAAPLETLPQQLAAADIILVATNATEPTILRHHLEGQAQKLIIDLSIPYNVAADAASLPNVQLVNVDELSRIKDETLQKRMAEVPRALQIIDTHLEEFNAWYKTRKYAPVLRAVKHQLAEINKHHLYTRLITAQKPACPEQRINKVISTLAVRVRQQDAIGCHCIEAINAFIA